jgi:septum site-determining protein MinD
VAAETDQAQRQGLISLDPNWQRDPAPDPQHPDLLGQGGVGKTTLTANLGIALARQGVRTAVLDADFGLRNLDLLLGLENRIVFTAQEVLAGSCRLEQALVKHKQEPNLALLPAGNPRMLEWLKPEDMQAIVGMLAPSFDIVLIDCPAGIEDGFKNAVSGRPGGHR